MTKSNRLTLIALIMMAIGVVVSGFTLWYVVTNREAFQAEIQKSLQQELAKYNLQVPQNMTVDEAKVYLAVVKYCENTGNCIGRTGANGSNGANGTNGNNGYTPVKGVDYFDGKDGVTPPCMLTEAQCQGADGSNGTNGENGREVERRCNADRQRMEWRLVGDPNWQVEFKLAPGQSCVKE